MSWSGLALAAGRASPVRSLLLLYGLGLFALPFLLQWVFQGHGADVAGRTPAVIRQGVYAVVLIGFVRTPEQFWIAAAAETLATFVAAVGLILYRRILGGRMRIKFGLSRQLLAEGAAYRLGQVFWTARMFGANRCPWASYATPADLGVFRCGHAHSHRRTHLCLAVLFQPAALGYSRGWARADGRVP